MGRARAARPGRGGGEGIPTLRAFRLRLTTSAAAVLLAAGLALYPALLAGRLVPPAAFLGGLGALAAVLSLLLRARLLGPALLLIAAAYAISEGSGHLPVASVLVYAPGLIVLAELVLWSSQLPTRGEADMLLVADQLLLLAGLGLAATLLGLLALAARAIVLGAIAAALLGCSAAAALLVLPRLLVGRER